MSAFILGVGRCLDVGSSMDRPQFRKATRNMVLAQLSIDASLLPMNSYLEKYGFDNFGLVLGSSHGELEITIRFLQTLAETGAARPILFQNSLHNSTTGFLAMEKKISGPVVTVSNLHFTGEDALDTAVLLLEQNQCNFCLVTAVEAKVSEIVPGLTDTMYGSDAPVEGAATLLLANANGLKMSRLPPICTLGHISYHYTRETETHRFDRYDSNVVELLAKKLQSPNGLVNGKIRFDKPNQSYSTIEVIC